MNPLCSCTRSSVPTGTMLRNNAQCSTRTASDHSYSSTSPLTSSYSSSHSLGCSACARTVAAELVLDSSFGNRWDISRSIQAPLPQLVDMFSVLQGILWLLIALLAEIPPAVCSANSSTEPPFRSSRHNVSGVHYSESEWYCHFLSAMSMLNAG